MVPLLGLNDEGLLVRLGRILGLALVRDFGVEAIVVVRDVFHNLLSAVGELDGVAAANLVAVALLGLTEVEPFVWVVDAVSVVVRLRGCLVRVFRLWCMIDGLRFMWCRRCMVDWFEVLGRVEGFFGDW